MTHYARDLLKQNPILSLDLSKTVLHNLLAFPIINDIMFRLLDA
jgi:hypothetical protein